MQDFEYAYLKPLFSSFLGLLEMLWTSTFSLTIKNSKPFRVNNYIDKLDNYQIYLEFYNLSITKKIKMTIYNCLTNSRFSIWKVFRIETYRIVSYISRGESEKGLSVYK